VTPLAPQPNSPSFAPWLRETMTRADFIALPEDDVQALRRFGTSRTYEAGTMLFHQGELPGEFFVVERGELELIYETHFERVVLQIVHAGSSIDHLAITSGVPYSYSALTLTEATVLGLRLDTIAMLEELYPEIAFRWLRLFAHTLDRAHLRLLEMSGRSAREQVTHLLLHESAESDEPTIDLTQHEVAVALALSRQTVSRVLHDLAREHVIRPERHRIRILDREKLRGYLSR
jgi:CRP-like cAMP-binding protein